MPTKAVVGLPLCNVGRPLKLSTATPVSRETVVPPAAPLRRPRGAAADHRNRAEDLLRTNLASSFVSNRALAGPTEPATSFFRIPCKDGLRTHLPRSEPREPGYLLFSLEDMLRRVDKTRK